MYCDFVLWTEKDLPIERIYPDVDFWYNKVIDRVQHFFTMGILPELLGKIFSRNNEEQSIPSSSLSSLSQSASEEGSSTQTYCYCHRPDLCNSSM